MKIIKIGYENWVLIMDNGKLFCGPTKTDVLKQLENYTRNK